MVSKELDEVDRAILHLLQEDARFTSAADIAKEVDVTANTVRNRIQRLEESGIIKGFVPLIDYEKADFKLTVVIRCTAPIPERTELAKEALGVGGVIEVRELMTGRRNVEVTVVADEDEQLTDAATALAELGFEIDDEELVKKDYEQPFDHFGQEDVRER
jgi:DNA-binding Lrp family transcriptional regulator